VRLPDKTEAGYLSVEQQLYVAARSVRAAGLTELIHYSLVKPGQERQVVLANPYLQNTPLCGTELLLGLIDAFEYNQSQGNGPLNAFEIGRVFWRKRKDWQKQTRSYFRWRSHPRKVDEEAVTNLDLV